jgi:hypothetical protein
MQGQGVSRDYAQAEKWLLCAASKGHGDAAYNLGILYEKRAPGLTGEPDHAAAAKYLQIAANQGIADGQCFLSYLYANGAGVPKDEVAAYQWMTLAAQNGNTNCISQVSPLLAQITADQIKEAKKRIAVWAPTPHPLFNY